MFWDESTEVFPNGRGAYVDAYNRSLIHILEFDKPVRNLNISKRKIRFIYFDGSRATGYSQKRWHRKRYRKKPTGEAIRPRTRPRAIYPHPPKKP